MKNVFLKMEVRRKIGALTKTVAVNGPWARTEDEAIQAAKRYLGSKGWPAAAISLEMHASNPGGTAEHKGIRHAARSTVDHMSAGFDPQ